MESAQTLEESDDPTSDAIRSVSQSLAEAKQMLMEHADEMGIDIESVKDDPEITANLERQRLAVESFEAVELAKRYGLDGRHVLETSSDWLGETDDPMQDEVLEILQWYVFFLAAKVHRGYHGIVDLDGDEDWDALNNVQSDANGTIKIALIAIERSILAWTYLLSNDNSDIIRPQIELLEKIRSLVEARFPNARNFIRPGFDEIEMVM
ncbi:MAG: hypothetical protein ACKVQW_01495 [Pyrinomonadaceae bacterium]